MKHNREKNTCDINIFLVDTQVFFLWFFLNESVIMIGRLKVYKTMLERCYIK